MKHFLPFRLQLTWRILPRLPLLVMPLAALLPTSGTGQTLVDEGVLRVGTVQHIGLSEGSGLVASRRHPGVVWSHNDGGYQFLFAMTTNGQAMGAFQVVGANLIDWEAIAIDDRGYLYLADIGGNGIERSHVAIHRLKEPKPSRRYGNAKVSKTWLLRFPGVKEDCESFFVSHGHGYLVTKPRTNDQVTMYRYPLSSRKRSIVLEEVTKLDVTAGVTDVSISADNQRLGVVTSEGVYLMFINGNPATANIAPREFTRLTNDFMEGGTFVPGGFLTSAETRELWLFTNANFQCTTPPSFVAPLTDKSVLQGSSIQFDGAAIGCPFPTYRWRFNGALLPGQTNASLLLSGITTANAGTYQVTASNPFGTVTSSAVLSVRSGQDLRITEVMPSPALDATVPTADWWELTSFETVPVDLSGWRFNDSSGDLADPYVIPPGLTIGPGETIVFVEGLTAADFRAWWGDANLPPDLQIVSYSGSGLSFRITGDTLYFWDNLSTDPSDTVARATFGVATTGVTFGYDPITGQFGTPSQLGVNGAVQAVTSSDIGSPGRIAAPEPVFELQSNTMDSRPWVRSRLAAGRVRIEFTTEAGRRYTLETCDDLKTGFWGATGGPFDAITSTNHVFEVEPFDRHRFFRVRVD